MRKLLIVGPAALSLALAPSVPIPSLSLLLAGAAGIALTGCAGGTSGIQTDIAAAVTAVIAGVQAACQVSPLATDVANLIPIYGGDVAAIISAICGAVKAAPTSGKMSAAKGIRMGVAPVVVHGVTVRFQ